MRIVLIVDESPDSREVLKTALERRGMRILEANRPEAGFALARQHRPDVVVVDLEADTADADAVSNGFAATTPRRPPRLLMLGNRQGSSALASGSEFIGKPYHYGPLVRKIERLMSDG